MRSRKAALISLIVFLCVGCDQATKSAAQIHLSSQPGSLLGDVLRFQYAVNEGSILGLGSGLPATVRFWLFTVLIGSALVGALIYVLNAKELNHPVIILGISLTLGGGLGNLVDRILNDGAVVDFVSVGIGNLRTAIFNLADVAILAGPVVMIVWNILSSRKGQQQDGAVKFGAEL